MKQISVSQIDLSKFIDVTPKWIQRLEERGVFKKKSGKYDLQQSVISYITFLRGSRDKTLAEAQRIHLEMKTKKLQLEAEVLEGNLLPKEELEKRAAYFVHDCESNFRDLPAWLTPILIQIEGRDNEEKLIFLILKYGTESCWRSLGGVKEKTPVLLPGETILVCLGLITGDKNGNVIQNGRLVSVREIKQKYGSGVDVLKFPAEEPVNVQS